MSKETEYQIIESDYNKYIEINGTRMVTTPVGISLKNNEAKYYIINQNNDFVGDFAVYNENNLMTLCVFLLKNECLVDTIFSFLKKQNYNYITSFLSKNDEDLIDLLKKKYSITRELVKQGDYYFYKIYLIL